MNNSDIAAALTEEVEHERRISAGAESRIYYSAANPGLAIKKYRSIDSLDYFKSEILLYGVLGNFVNSDEVVRLVEAWSQSQLEGAPSAEEDVVRREVLMRGQYAAPDRFGGVMMSGPGGPNPLFPTVFGGMFGVKNLRLVMERFTKDGCDLAHGPTQLPVRVVESIVAQIDKALTYIHGAGYVHADVKTSNIFLRREVKNYLDPDARDVAVVLGDFSITSKVGTTFPLDGSSPFYSPSVHLGNKPTPADDFWALGATAYELGFGRRLFSSRHYADLLRWTGGDCPALVEGKVSATSDDKEIEDKAADDDCRTAEDRGRSDTSESDDGFYDAYGEETGDESSSDTEDESKDALDQLSMVAAVYGPYPEELLPSLEDPARYKLLCDFDGWPINIKTKKKYSIQYLYSQHLADQANKSAALAASTAELSTSSSAAPLTESSATASAAPKKIYTRPAADVDTLASMVQKYFDDWKILQISLAAPLYSV